MEALLDLYEEPYDPKRPIVCFDERPCQLVCEVREPLPMEPGRSERLDFEYRRGGMAYVLMAFEPLTGWREIGVGKRRRKQEFAQEVRRLLGEETYLSAEKIRLVVDDLSTHTPLRPSTRPSH